MINWTFQLGLFLISVSTTSFLMAIVPKEGDNDWDIFRQGLSLTLVFIMPLSIGVDLIW